MTEHAYGPECLKSGEETCLHENIKVDNGKNKKRESNEVICES